MTASFSVALGQSVRSTVTFKHPITQALTDPATVKLYATSPKGVVTTYSYNPGDIVKLSTGVYELVWEPTEEGTWAREWEGVSATFEAYNEAEIYVRISQAR